MQSKNNKIILRVKADKNNHWYHFGKGRYRLQLAGDPRRDGYWIDQYAERALGKGGSDRFMGDFTKILKLMCEENAEIFALYEMPEVMRWTQDNEKD